MNICLVSHKILKGDGQGRVNYEIACAALAQGHQVTLLAQAVSTDLQCHPQLRWQVILPGSLPTKLLKNAVFARRSGVWLKRHRSQIDVLQVNGSITTEPSDVNTAHFVHGVWLKSPMHTVRLQHNLYGAYQGLYTWFNAQWEKTAYRQTRVVVAVSRRVADELQQLGVPSERLRIITNGVDLTEFHPGEADRVALGLPSTGTLALFVGDIQTPRKNLDTVLRALVQVPDVHLVVLGKREGSPYPALAKQLQISDRTCFLGFRSDTAQIMRACDLLVAPSRYEPFSLVVLEAMACGLPVITAQTVGAANLISEDCGMVLSNPDDTVALVEALERLTSDAVSRRRMGSVACRVAQQHSWSIMANAYLALYEELAGIR